jgi:hypothetical protein
MKADADDTRNPPPDNGADGDAVALSLSLQLTGESVRVVELAERLGNEMVELILAARMLRDGQIALDRRLNRGRRRLPAAEGRA